MRYRKLLSYVLIFVFIFSSFPHAWAANNNVNSAVSEITAQKASILFDLGIAVPPEDDIDWNTQSATLAQFLNVCMNISTGSKIPDVTIKLPYDDVYAGHEYYKAIAYAYSLGVIPNQEQLNPDSQITKQHALSIAANTLGFCYINKYITNYSRYFKNSEMSDGVTGTDVLTLSDIYNVGYNIMCMNTLEAKAIVGVNGDFEISTETDECFAKRCFGYDVVNGRVTATSLASINGKSVADGKVSIGNVVYNCDDEDFIDKIGLYADVFIKGDKIEYCVATTPGDDIIEIDANNYSSFDGTKVHYIEDDKNKSQTVRNPVIIFNGEEVSGTDYDKTLLDISEGTIRLVKYEGVVDCIVVKSYSSFVVNSIYTDNNGITKISAKNIDKRVLTIDTNEMLRITNSFGTAANVSDISSGTLITYAKSINGKYTELIIGKDGFYGDDIKCKYSSGKLDSVNIDGKTYHVNDEVMLGNVKYTAGGDYNWYLTPFGNIGAITSRSREDDKIAYLWKTKTDSGLDGDVRLRFVDNTNYDSANALVLYAADKLRVDGQMVKKDNLESKLSLFNGTTELPVIYRTNSEGKVNYIDTPYYDSANESENSLIKRSVPQREIELGGIHCETDDRYKNEFARAFIVPFDGIIVINDGKEAYTVDQMIGGQRLDENLFGIYTIGSKTFVSDIVVYNSASASGKLKYKDIYYVVKSQGNTIDDRGDTAYEYELYANGKTFSYFKSDNAALPEVKTGDIVKIALDPRGRIQGFNVLLAYADSKSKIGYTNSPTYNIEKRIAYGKLVNIEYNDSIAKYVVTYYLKDIDDIETVFIDSNAMKSISVERDTLNISNIMPENAKRYLDYGTSADNVLVFQSWSIAEQIYFYRE